MADVLVEIGKSLLEDHAKDLWNQISGNEYGDAEKSTQAILAAIKDARNSIIQELTAVMLTNELGQQTTHIETWTQELGYCLKAKHENKDRADKDLDAKMDQLSDSTDGIAYVLNRIDSILRQSTSISNVGLIKLGCQRLDQDLCDPKQLDKDLCWYMLRMNKFLAAAVRWQTAGLALRLFTARKDNDRRDHYIKAWRKNIDAQLEYTRESYHPMIRSFKFSFWDKIPDSRLWRLRVPKAPDWYFMKYSDRWLYKGANADTLWLRDNLPATPDPAIYFRFSPPLDQPNPSRQTGAWSILQNAALPGQSLGHARFREVSGHAVVGRWEFKLMPKVESPYTPTHVKLCPIDKENRAFRMVVEGQDYLSDTRNSDFLFSNTYEADHVEGTGWL